ncbi:MAG: hypothetical protein IPM29_30260 [Planctomycetes bacterium]|nr:hypothetical protein [Planctomycetota bacterium]
MSPSPDTDPRATTVAALARLQRRLAAALRDLDPVAAVRALADDPEFPGAWRSALRAAAPAGVRLTERLVVSLRFDRLLAASADARRRLAADPRGFAALFDRYHRTVAPRAWHPLEEAHDFARFVAGEPAGA